MADRYDVKIREHAPWESGAIRDAVESIMERASQLYPLIKPDEPEEHHEELIRRRMMIENKSLGGFARDHPRLFALATAKRTTKEAAMREQIYTLLSTFETSTSQRPPLNLVKGCMEASKK